MTTARVWRRIGQRSDPAFIVERHTAISQGVTVWGSNFLGHTIIFSGPSRHFDSSQIRGRYFNARLCYPCYQVAQVPFINRIMLVHILRDSPNNVFKDMTSYHGLPGHQIFSPIEHVWTLGRQLQPSRYRRINCADAKTMAGSSTRGHK
ncbi:hypothetical protein TNCV_4201591 [Trichonephila clavipes]|uniref:Uncharacterized protein n=1 Tax=Trichonephila clavipes TaxID=2585209 RepID=A0A8X6WCS0_TRICX|nr:hypothetical protein TNCV_4201591 [Trichonephila clavipes]